MKKLGIKILGLAILATVVFTSCDNGDDPIPPMDGVLEALSNGEMNGTLPESVTLNSATSYDLTGSFIVPDGMTLTIPAGTNIVADNGGS